MENRKVFLVRLFTGAVLWLGLAMPGIAHSTTAAQVCAVPGNSCAGTTANINVATLATCSSGLDFVAAGFPDVNVNAGGSLQLEPGLGVACSLTLIVRNLLVQSGGAINADRARAFQRPGKIIVNASGTITVAVDGEITAIGGTGPPSPTIELFAVGNVNIAGLIEARGTRAIGVGGHITIESRDQMVIVAATGVVRAGSSDPGGTRIVIRACLGIEIAGVVDATAKKRAAEVQLFSRETIRINGGEVIADVVIGEQQPGDMHRVVIEARDDIIVSNSALISANSGRTNKVGGTIEALSTQGAITCTSSRILANALAPGSNGGTVRLRSFETVTPNCTIQARGNVTKGEGGTVLIQSFAQNILGPANVSATAQIPGTIVLRACANPITDGGTYTPAAIMNPGQCVAAPTSGVNFVGGIPACGLPLICQPATGSSMASGLAVDLTILPALGGGIPVTVGPIPTSMASGPPPMVDNDQLAFVSIGIPLTGNILTTGLLQTTAVVNLPTVQNANAAASVANPDLDLVGSILLPLLGLNATVIESTANVGGVCGSSVTGAGTTTILKATGSGVLTGVVIDASPAPNTVLLDLVGIVRITLNEQTETGNGVNSRGLTVNAIHIEVDAINLTGLLGLNIGVATGDIIISQSQAQLQCVCP